MNNDENSIRILSKETADKLYPDQVDLYVTMECVCGIKIPLNSNENMKEALKHENCGAGLV